MKRFFNRHQKSLIDLMTIFPTSWNIFIAIASYFGVVEFFGPFFRYMISSWQSLTREMWDYFLFSHFDILVREADKDALTFSLFFIIFGYSLIPEVRKITNSNNGDKRRKVKWKLFPIAFVISSTITMLVISHLFHLDGTEKYKAFSFVFTSVIFLIFYSIAGFVPIFISYAISTAINYFSNQKKDRTKETLTIILFLSSVYFSFTLFTTSFLFEYFKATIYVTCTVAFLVILIPLLMPIIQPDKLIKLAIFCLMICGVAYASYTIEFFKQRAIAENDGHIKDTNSAFSNHLKNKIDTNCASYFVKLKNDEKGGALIFSVITLFSGKTEADIINDTCPCIAAEIIKNEKLELIEKLSIKSEFEKSMDDISSFDIFDVCRMK